MLCGFFGSVCNYFVTCMAGRSFSSAAIYFLLQCLTLPLRDFGVVVSFHFLFYYYFLDYYKFLCNTCSAERGTQQPQSCPRRHLGELQGGDAGDGC